MERVDEGIQRGEVGGVPVFWAERRPPAQAALLFRVGRADETLATSGMSHLIEHLALTGLGRRGFDYNGGVSDIVTAFQAVGTADEVAGFIRDVAAQLSRLPFDRLDAEKRVVRVEDEQIGDDPHGRLMSLRFGARTYGLIGYRQLGLRWLGPDELEEWRAECFTRENAAIWTTGPEPLELDALELPAGARRPPPDPAPIRGLELPTYADATGDWVGASFLTARSTALTVGLAVASERLTDVLRHEQSLIYGTLGTYVPLTASKTHVTLAMQTPPDRAARVRDGMLDVLRRLADEGPTPDELAADRDRYAAFQDDPDEVLGRLVSRTEDELLGARAPTKDELRAERAAAAPEGVASAISDALASAVMAVPEGLRRLPAGFAEYGTWTLPAVDGRPVRPRRTEWGKRYRQGVTITVGEEGVSWQSDDMKEPVSIRFDECAAAVGEFDGALRLIGVDGSHILLKPYELEDGDAVMDEIAERLPPRALVPPEPGVVELERLADDKLKRRWTVRDELTDLAGVLGEDESVVNLAEASRGVKAGLLAVTDQRVLWLYNGIRRDDYWQATYEQLTWVDSSGLLGAKLRFQAGDEKIQLTDITPRARAGEIADYVAARIV